RQESVPLVVENAQKAGEQKLIISFKTLVGEPQSVLKGFRMEELPDPLRDVIIRIPWTRKPRRRAVDARIINRVDYQGFSYEIFEMLVPRSNCLTGSGSPSVRRDENPTHYFSSLLTTLLVAI